MQDRRTFLGLAVASLLPAAAGAQTAAPAPASAIGPREIARHSLTGPLDGFDVVLVDLHPEPGTGRDHRHTGPVLGYVVDGQVRFGVDHKPEQTLAAGRTFFEPTGAVHSTFGSADGKAVAHVLAFMVVPKGSSGTVPA
jgi:quercetin dioxygenase-like cupin family protein